MCVVSTKNVYETHLLVLGADTDADVAAAVHNGVDATHARHHVVTSRDVAHVRLDSYRGVVVFKHSGSRNGLNLYECARMCRKHNFALTIIQQLHTVTRQVMVKTNPPTENKVGFFALP